MVIPWFYSLNSAAGVVPIQTVCMKLMNPSALLTRDVELLNATDMLIVEAYRNLLETSASIAKRFHMSDTYVHEIFDRYVKLDRLPLTDAISIDEVHLDMDDDS